MLRRDILAEPFFYAVRPFSICSSIQCDEKCEKCPIFKDYMSLNAKGSEQLRSN